MTRRCRHTIYLLFAWLLVLPQALCAQGFPAVDNSPYHASSVYFITLVNADGENVNSEYAAIDGAIGGFVGGTLRGSSQWQPTGQTAGDGFFVVRVWGDKDDPALVTFRLCNSSKLEQELGTQPFSQGSEGTYGTPSAPIQLVVKEWVIQDVTMSFANQELTVSKFRDTALLLTKDENTGFQPALVELVFDTAENGQPAAVAIMTDYTGLRWSVRGQYAGQYIAKIRYNGKEQVSVCRINVQAEYPIEPGWQWMSFYAIGNEGFLPLKNGSSWSPIWFDDDNHVTDIRTQKGVLHYDSEHGYIGNLEILKASDGAFKVHGEYFDYDTDRMVLNAGYANLLKGSSLPMPKVKKGYTWMNYPHEVPLNMEALSPHLSKTAFEGDMLIGSDGFAEFDGDEWMATSNFLLTPGSGYIYYTDVAEPRLIDWGQALPPMTPSMARRTSSKNSVQPWSYNPARYPDCMPVVACLQGIDHPEDYIIGAFVGDECRGMGEAADNGLMYVAISGQRGDVVTFRLYQKATDSFIDIETTKISFTDRVGSYRNPLQLYPDITGISLVSEDSQSTIHEYYDLQGRRQNGSRLTSGLNIITITEGDRRVTRKIICR